MVEISALAAPPGAACSEHPDQQAVFTCFRCTAAVGACCANAYEGRGFCASCGEARKLVPKPWRRIGASVVDVLLLFQPLMSASSMSAHLTADTAGVVALVATIASFALFALSVVLVAVRGQTLAMVMLGLRFPGAEAGETSGFRLALLRYVLPMSALLGIMYLPLGHFLAAVVNFAPLWISGRATLVDRITRTTVVRA